MELPEISYDEVYTYDLSSQVKFWNLPLEEVYELFRDGRTASRFLERKIPYLFADFKYVDEKGYDWAVSYTHLTLPTIYSV